VQVGSLRADKGGHLTVEAMHSLTRERDRLELHLVGAAPDPEYKARLERRGAGIVLRFHPDPLSPAEIAALLASAHLFSAPATADGTWGFALAEAMAVGLPVVHSNIADQREFVGGAGVEVQAGDVKQLGSAFRKLFRDRVHWEDRSASALAWAASRYGDEDAIRARLCRLLTP
jgi:glycosyltransferase involved in cell wall biosynthesis